MKSVSEILEELGYDSVESGMRKCDGFDDCVVGVVARCGSEDILCYDVDMIIKKLMSRDGMTEEEASDFYSFNIEGAYVGEWTPCFLRRAQ